MSFFLTSVKQLTIMNRDYHVSFCVFFIIFEKKIHVSTQWRAKVSESMFYIQFGPYIRYSFSI